MIPTLLIKKIYLNQLCIIKHYNYIMLRPKAKHSTTIADLVTLQMWLTGYDDSSMLKIVLSAEQENPKILNLLLVNHLTLFIHFYKITLRLEVELS